MAKDKKSFILYADLINTVKLMPTDKAGELFMHILKYVNDENPKPIDLMVELVFEPIKQQLKRDLVKFEQKKVQWSEAGKRSAEVRKAKKDERTLTNVESRSTDSTVNVNVSVNDNVINNNIPTFEDFKMYAWSKKKDVNMEALKLKYESWVENGWKDGNDKPIKNWKTKILNSLPYLKERKQTFRI